MTTKEREVDRGNKEEVENKVTLEVEEDIKTTYLRDTIIPMIIDMSCTINLTRGEVGVDLHILVTTGIIIIEMIDIIMTEMKTKLYIEPHNSTAIFITLTPLDIPKKEESDHHHIHRGLVSFIKHSFNLDDYRMKQGESNYLRPPY